MFKIFKWVFRGVVTLIFVISLTLNIASFVGGALWFTASKIVQSATGVKTFAVSQVEKINMAKSETRLARNQLDDAVTNQRALERRVSGLQDDLGAQRRIYQNTKRELVEAQADLIGSRKLARRLEGEIADPLTRMVSFRGRQVALREVVAETTDGISRRATKTASRELASMTGEAIPFWGTAVIVGVTALELKDLCDTVKDMNRLKVAFNPELAPDPSETTVCSMRVPTREELWETTKSAPGDAWAAAREATPTLEEIGEWELPDVDAKAMWLSTKSGTASVAGWAKDQSIAAGTATWEATKEASGSALDATSSGIQSLTTKTLELFSGAGE